MEPTFWVWALLVVVFTAAAAVVDMRTHRLPNVLTVPAFALGVVFHVIWGWVSEGPWGAFAGLGWSLAGFAVGFGILFVLWLIGGGGGGDVKFMGALGAWLGPRDTAIVFVASAFINVALLAVIRTWQFVEGKKPQRVQDPDPRVRRRAMSYGLPVALATWIVLALQLWNQAQAG